MGTGRRILVRIGEHLPEIRIVDEQDVRSMDLVSPGDRADIIDMIMQDWTDEEILETMPHVERRSVTAFRAHVTRGTYSTGDSKWRNRRGH